MRTAFSATAPRISPEEEQRELQEMPESVRNEILQDRAGICPQAVTETPALILTSTARMMDALDMIEESQKRDYLEAIKRVPDLVEKESPCTAFLRCENYDALAAAERLVAYWKTRRTVFGPSKAFLPLTQEGALADDGETLRKHYFKILAKDKKGRPTFYFDRSGFVTNTSAERDSVLRCFFYLYQKMALESNSNQQLGCIAVFNARGFDMYKHYDRILTKRNCATMVALPMKVRTVHILLGSTSSVFSMLLPTVKVIMGPSIRHRLKFHQGTNKELVTVLVDNGIDETDISAIVHARENKDVYYAWLDQQVSEERSHERLSFLGEEENVESIDRNQAPTRSLGVQPSTSMKLFTPKAASADMVSPARTAVFS